MTKCTRLRHPCLVLSQPFVECFVLPANQVNFALQKATKNHGMDDWFRVSVRTARGIELAVAAIQQFWVGLLFCLVFKSNLISWLSVEYCNNSAVNTIKSQFAEMASGLVMENLHEIHVMLE